MGTAREEWRIRAICAQSVVADGATWLREMRREHEWISFKRRVDQIRLRRVLDDSDEMVDPRTDLMVATPERQASGIRSADDKRIGDRFHLGSAESIIRFRPLEIVHGIDCALFIAAIEDDAVTPMNHALDLYREAMPPKKLVVQSGVSHYEGAIENYPVLAELSLDWFERYVQKESPPEQCVVRIGDRSGSWPVGGVSAGTTRPSQTADGGRDAR